MQKHIASLLICPKCGKDLKLKAEEYIGSKIKKGLLECDKCQKKFPIIDFIPRFVSSEFYTSSFGDEWKIYKNVKTSRPQISKNEMKNYLNIEKKDVENKLVLEVGCGSGPYLDICAREFNAKHIIGIDLSRAVDAAYENVGYLENVTIIQADLFDLPFKKNSFDLVYSLGVLHHTPDTKKAFKSISKFVKNSGILSIWVYGYYWRRKIDSQQWLRRNFFNKLNSKQIKLFSKFAANFLYYLYLIPILGDGLRERFTIGMDKDRNYRELNTFDIYSPKFINYHYMDEVYRWFKEEEFKDVEPSRWIVGFKGYKS